MSDMFMALSLHNDGTELHVHWGVLCPFVSAERILKEFGLANEHNPRVGTYNETTERILAAYPGDQVIYSDPQVVQLPFAVEALLQNDLIWGHGDVLLRNEFFLGRLPVQYMPLLRIVMRSQAKAAAKKSRGWNRVSQSARESATPPPRPPPQGGPFPPRHNLFTRPLPNTQVAKLLITIDFEYALHID